MIEKKEFIRATVVYCLTISNERGENAVITEETIEMHSTSFAESQKELFLFVFVLNYL